MTVPSDVEALIAAEQAEWGQYVAVRPIFLDGARAFNEGHAVPASHVDKFDLLNSGQVRRVGDPIPVAPEPAAPPQGEDVLINQPENTEVHDEPEDTDPAEKG